MDPSPSASSSGLFPLPRRDTPTDTLFYAIYPSLSPNLPPSTIISSLSSLHLQINGLLAPYLSSYIFHRDPFHLSLPSSLSSTCSLCHTPPLPHLHGKTHFADSISDEWFIVSLLFLVSRSFSDLIIHVWDTDGEFLLIEAAFHIPNWLDPDTSPNRVFIHKGELHIVPKEVFPSTPSLPEALKTVRDKNISTRASDKVQTSISKRIEGYPEKARENMHRVRVRVPLKVAQVLKTEPCLISLAVEGFYDRDIDTMKHAAKMEKFLKTKNGEVEMVRVSVSMTRAMYGQLVQQRFQAPRNYPMPSMEDTSAYMEAELGLKIACGFEMMYQEKLRGVKDEKGTTWLAFKKSLENSGCFDGLLEGSKEYNRILDETKEYYDSTSLASRTREIIGAPVGRIDEILSLNYSSNDFESINLPPNDDDSWLYGGEDEINSVILEREREMEEYESKNKNKNKNRSEFNVGDIASSMQEFVRNVSSFEGAEIPNDKNSMDVQLDADHFFKAMESVLNCRDAAEDSPSEMDFDDIEEKSDSDEEDNNNNNNKNNNDEDLFMESYSDALNKELSGSTVNKSFVRANQFNNTEGTSSGAAKEDEEDGDELSPVDVDLNLMQSFLESFSCQQGLAGPASNLLGLMGVKKPPPDSNKKD